MKVEKKPFSTISILNSIEPPSKSTRISLRVIFDINNFCMFEILKNVKKDNKNIYFIDSFYFSIKIFGFCYYLFYKQYNFNCNVCKIENVVNVGIVINLV